MWQSRCLAAVLELLLSGFMSCKNPPGCPHNSGCSWLTTQSQLQLGLNFILPIDFLVFRTLWKLLVMCPEFNLFGVSVCYSRIGTNSWMPSISFSNTTSLVTLIPQTEKFLSQKNKALYANRFKKPKPERQYRGYWNVVNFGSIPSTISSPLRDTWA